MNTEHVKPASTSPKVDKNDPDGSPDNPGQPQSSYPPMPLSEHGPVEIRVPASVNGRDLSKGQP